MGADVRDAEPEEAGQAAGPPRPSLLLPPASVMSCAGRRDFHFSVIFIGGACDNTVLLPSRVYEFSNLQRPLSGELRHASVVSPDVIIRPNEIDSLQRVCASCAESQCGQTRLLPARTAMPPPRRVLWLAYLGLLCKVQAQGLRGRISKQLDAAQQVSCDSLRACIHTSPRDLKACTCLFMMAT